MLGWKTAKIASTRAGAELAACARRGMAAGVIPQGLGRHTTHMGSASPSGVRGFHQTAMGRDTDKEKAEWDFDQIFRKNRVWVSTKREQDSDFFKRLANTQHPKILWIGCSDARVPANTICGLTSGDVFVQRNIANMVVGTDANAMSVIQYAVDFLQVPHIVVCGHYDCGGVRAALRNMNHGSPLENWLRNIRDVWRLHREELKQIPSQEARVRRLVELNVAEQCLNIYKSAPVQKRRWDTKLKGGRVFPIIHGVVYDPANGELNRVPIDIHQKVGELRECYDLYDFDSPDLHESFN
mmetsp:Transcript_16920/g.40959  ORF Transcript_16920/g.40959 Transcript_16920/m.40959 type:complete len:297 (+) Transcript_16920:75-965(+)